MPAKCWYLPTTFLKGCRNLPRTDAKAGPEDAHDHGEPGEALGVPTCSQGGSENN